MTSHELAPSGNVSEAFLANARSLLSDEYLPKIERCIEKLSNEQIWWRPNDQSNSIGNLILHLCGNARQWIVCGLGNEADKRERQSEFAERGPIPREELLKLLQDTIRDVDRVLAEFDVWQLLESYPIQGTESTALAAIFHVTEHFSMHTGQIILVTKILAKLDLVFYDFSSGKPTHTWYDPTATVENEDD